MPSALFLWFAKPSLLTDGAGANLTLGFELPKTKRLRAIQPYPSIINGIVPKQDMENLFSINLNQLFHCRTVGHS